MLNYYCTNIAAIRYWFAVISGFKVEKHQYAPVKNKKPEKLGTNHL